MNPRSLFAFACSKHTRCGPRTFRIEADTETCRGLDQRDTRQFPSPSKKQPKQQVLRRTVNKKLRSPAANHRPPTPPEQHLFTQRMYGYWLPMRVLVSTRFTHGPERGQCSELTLDSDGEMILRQTVMQFLLGECYRFFEEGIHVIV